MAKKLATQKGKEFALKALEERRKKYKNVKQIDNSRLPAGSRMYFYCITCGGLSDELPESYTCTPNDLCDECKALKKLGWLE